MSDASVIMIRRGHKVAICITEEMSVDIAGGVGFSLKGDFTGVKEIVLVSKQMYDELVREAPQLFDRELVDEIKPGGTV